LANAEPRELFDTPSISSPWDLWKAQARRGACLDYPFWPRRKIVTQLIESDIRGKWREMALALNLG